MNRAMQTGPHRTTRHVIMLAWLLLASGCASQYPSVREQVGERYPFLELYSTPFFPQQAFQCGPAALATILNSTGVKVSPDELKPQVFLPGRRGSLQLELLAATRRHGRIPYVIDPDFQHLAAQLHAGRPVLVLQNVGFRHLPAWHYAVVIGIDPVRDEVILRSGTSERLMLDSHEFLDSWAQAGNWALVALVPGELPARADPVRYLEAVEQLLAMRRDEDALLAYQAAASAWPELPMAALGTGSALYNQGRIPEAVAVYRRILTRWPDNVVALNNLGMMLAEQGCRDEALALIERALQQDKGGLMEQLQESRREVMMSPASASQHCQ